MASIRSVALAVALCFSATAGQAQDDPDSLPEGAGREDAFYMCSACHSFQVVSRQGMTREMWDSTIQLMNDRHRMIELLPDERERILTYLAETYPPVAGGASTGRRGWTNPF